MNKYSTKAYIGALTIVTAIVGFVGTAGATADADVVDAVTAGGTNMSDTMLAIASALIPLAIGVFVARKAWRVIRGFF